MTNTSLYNYTASDAVDTSTMDHTFDGDTTPRALFVASAGDIDLTTVAGDRDVYTFETAANGGAYPFILPVQVKTIHRTSTTVPDADIIALR